MGYFQWLFHKVSHCYDDRFALKSDPASVRSFNRAFMFGAWVSAASALLSIVVEFNRAIESFDSNGGHISQAVIVVASIGIVYVALLTAVVYRAKRVSTFVMNISIIVCALCFFFTHWVLTVRTQAHLFLTDILDGSVVIQAHPLVQFVVFILYCVCVGLRVAEVCYGKEVFLFRPEPYDDRHSLWYFLEHLIPCLITYTVCRTTSTGMQREKDKMHRTLLLTEELAAKLARMDVEGVLERIDTEERENGLVSAMVPLRDICYNLKKFRPFLPDSLFLHHGAESEAREQDSDSEGSSVLSSPQSGGTRKSDGASNEDREETRKNISMSSSNISTPSNPSSGVFLELRLCQRKVAVMSALLPKLSLECCESSFGCIEEVLERFVGCVKEHRGYVWWYGCGKLFATWNANSNRIAQPLCAAVECGCRCAEREYNTLGEGLSVAVGIDVGYCLCGNVGTSQLMFTEVYGPAVRRAETLSGLCGVWGGRVFLDGTCVSDISQIAATRVVEAVLWVADGVQGTVYDVTHVFDSKEEPAEWMYVLEGRENSNHSNSDYEATMKAISSSSGEDFTATVARIDLLAQVHSKDNLIQHQLLKIKDCANNNKLNMRRQVSIPGGVELLSFENNKHCV